jgi:glycosyltransferase involved in cell wall biosynthesis
VTTARAVVAVPADAGQGSLSSVAADMAEGLRAEGAVVELVGLPRRTGLRRAATRRPLRRFPRLARELDRRALLGRLPEGADLLYVPCGYLPPRAGAGVRVAHQWSRHPRLALEAQERARREAGGGRSFISSSEASRWERDTRRANLIRVESAAVGEELAADGVPAERIVHAPPGVDLERFRPGRKAERLTVAFVGSLALWKGADLLEPLRRALPRSATLAIVGGPVCPWSRRLAGRLDAERRRDPRQLLAGAQALVLPSISESFGHVVLEAMASGAVPFVTPEVGAAEVVRELDPRLVQPRSEFCDAVAGLVETLPIEELGRQARRIAEGYERGEMGRQAARALLDASGLDLGEPVAATPSGGREARSRRSR